MVELTGWIGGVHSQHRGTFAGHTGHRRWSQWCATAMRNIFGIMALSENWAKKINGFDGSFSPKKSSDFFLPKKNSSKKWFWWIIIFPLMDHSGSSSLWKSQVPMIQAAQVGIGIAGREGALSLANGDFWGWWFYMILWLIVVNGWWRMDNGWWLPDLVNIEKKLWNITIW